MWPPGYDSFRSLSSAVINVNSFLDIQRTSSWCFALFLPEIPLEWTYLQFALLIEKHTQQICQCQYTQAHLVLFSCCTVFPRMLNVPSFMKSLSYGWTCRWFSIFATAILWACMNILQRGHHCGIAGTQGHNPAIIPSQWLNRCAHTQDWRSTSSPPQCSVVNSRRFAYLQGANIF